MALWDLSGSVLLNDKTIEMMEEIFLKGVSW